MEKNNAKMYDTATLLAAGIDPKTKLPVKMSEGCNVKRDIKRQLRIIDLQDAVNRYTWYNLPKGLNGRLIERILYYKGQGMMFVMNDKFYFLPYALDGSIDVYGRFTGVTPLPFNGTTTDGKEKPLIQGLVYKPVYEYLDPADYMDKSFDANIAKLEESCVLLKDYTEQMSQTIISRQIVNDSLLDVMANCFPFMMTALSNSTGVMGMRVNTEAEQANVDAASNAVNKAALEGKKYIGIVGNVDFQEMTGGTVANAEEFLVAMQALDNYRLSTYGLENGGIFEKKAHLLQSEQEMNSGKNSLVAEDGLRNRQEFCTIANSIWGTSMWCEPSESAIGADMNGDFIVGSDDYGVGEESQPMETEVSDDV